MPDSIERAVYELDTRGTEKIDAAAQSIDRLTVAEQKQERAKRATAAALEKWITVADRQIRVVNQYRVDLDRLARYEREEVGTAEQRARALEMLTDKYVKNARAAQDAATGYSKLQAKFDPATTSAKQMNAELGELNKAFRLGINIAGGYTNAYATIVAKYGEGSAEAKAARAAQLELNNTLQGFRDELDATLPVLRAYEAELENLARLEKAGLVEPGEAAVIRQHIDTKFNARYRQASGQDAADKKAADEQNRLNAALEKTLNVVDPTRAATLRYNAALAELKELLEKTDLGAENAALAEARLTEAYNKEIAAIRGVSNAEEELAAKRARNAISRAGSNLTGDASQVGVSRQRYTRTPSFFDILDENKGTGAPTKGASALGDAADEEERLNKLMEEHLKIVLPVREATIKFNDAVARQRQLFDAGKISLLEYTVAEKKLTEAYEQQKRAILGLDEAERKARQQRDANKADAQTAENAQERLTASAQAYMDKLDPVSAVTRKYKEELANVAELEKAGALNRMQASRITKQLGIDHDELVKKTKAAADAQNGLSKGMLGATQQSRAMQFAVTNLTFQLNDVFTSIASGQSVTRTMAQQFGQFVQVFQQGGGIKNVLTEFGATIARLATPLNLFLVGIAAVGVGLVALVARANATESRLRGFDVILRAMGARGQTSAAGLDEVVKNLRDTGTAADDAYKAVQQFARVPGINPAFASKLVPLARDIAAVTGEDFGSIGARMAEAFSKGTDEAIKFAQAIGGPNALTAKEIANMQQMALHGDRAGALRIEIAALQRQFGGSFQDAMSDSTKAVNNISAAWNNFLDALSKTTAVQMAKNAIIGMLQGIANAVNAPNPQTPVESANAARRAQNLPPLTPVQEAELNRQRMGQSNVAGGALTGATSTFTGSPTSSVFSTTANAALGQVDPQVVRDFERTLIESGMRAVISSTTGGSHTTGSQHYPRNTVTGMGEALDYNLIDPETGRVVTHAEAHVPGSRAERLYRDFEYRFKALRPDEYRAGVDFNDPGHVDRGLISGAAPGRLAGRLGGGPQPGEQTFGSGFLAKGVPQAEPLAVAPGLNETQKALIHDQEVYNNKLAEANKLTGEAKVYQTAYLQALGAGTKDTFEETQARDAATQAVRIWRIEIDKAAETQKITNDLALSEARLYGTDVVAGYKAAAAGAAQLAVRQGEAYDAAAKTQEILTTQAVQAIRAGREAVAAAQPQIARQQQLVDAAQKSEEAWQDQAIANAAAEKTQDAVNRAKASGITVLKDEADALYAAALAQEKLNAEQKAGLEGQSEIKQLRATLRSTQLETGLTASGLPSDAITRQLDYLQAVEKLNTQLLKAPPEIRESYAATATAVADAKYQLQQVQREQERWNDLVRDLTSSIQNELTRAIEDAFNEEKVESWGKRIQKWLASAASQLSNSLFIKPALGTLAGSLGFGTVAQSLGTFGSLGGGTSLFGGSGGGTGQSAVITQKADGTFSLSTLSSGASLVNSGWSLLGGGSTGTLGFLDTIGEKLGFSTNLQGPTLSGAPLGTGSLFSSSFGSFLGGAGAGLGAGLLTNSLLGGTKLGGTIGSTTGALTGALLGSIFPGVGTFVGGIVGGAAGGGLGGLFGQTHKRANASGLSIDLSTGAVSGFTSAGSAENDKAVREIRDSLTDFTKDIQSTTKGTVSGYINPQVTDQGTILDYNIPGYGAGSYKAEDTQDAIDKAELAIARGLTGITDNMKKVIDQITDPKDLDAAIKFAESYDKIAEAAKDAFASIPSDLDVKGTFAKAKDDIKDIFDELTDDAKKYGLSLTPINDALAEANRRLTKDFDRYIKDLITAAEDPLQSLVDIEKRAGDQRLADAKAVNGDILQVNKYNAMALDKIWDDSTKSIKDFQKELKYGESSGLTATQRLKQAQADYDLLLADVKTGKSAKFEDFVTAGKALYNLSTEAYGQGPKTVGLRKDILKAIDDVLATRSFAKGGLTGAGWNRYGEHGAEWVYTPSPSTVLPNGQLPPMGSSEVDMSEVCSLLGDIVTELRANTDISRLGHSETVDRLDGMVEQLQRPASYEPARRRVTA